MSHVLTFVASNQDFRDHTGLLKQAALVLDHYNIRAETKPVWLKDGVAADIFVSGRPQNSCMRHLRDELADARIDLFVNEVASRRKKLMLADMDSTIVKAETLDELAEYAGIKDKIAEITALAMNGKLDFHEALEARVALLKGLDAGKMGETLARMEINPGAHEFIRAMKENGATCVLVSGGFTFFTEAIGRDVGFDFHHGNILDIEEGVLKGTVSPPILDKFSKLQFLNDYAARQGIALEHSLTIGDGANDLPMLKAAGLGIGYYPKPAVAEELDNLILYGDFTAALYAQGILPRDAVD